MNTKKMTDLCPVARECGACSAIHVPYAQQLEEKQRFVIELFEELAGDECLLLPIAGMENPFQYRNKIASPFAPGRRLASASSRSQNGRARSKTKSPTRKRGGLDYEVRCGMYAAGTHRIIEANTCAIEHPSGRRIIQAVRQLMMRYGVAPYNEDAGTGFMRHCVVRVGHESGEVLVTLVTNGEDFPGGRNFARELVKRCPEITTVVQNVNTQATNAILGRKEHTLYGPGFILDTLCGLSFRISAHSFYQVNSTQTEVLYRAAMRAAGLEGDANPCVSAQDDSADAPSAQKKRADQKNGLTIIDAYCGTGTIGLVAASMAHGARVIGVDNVESAIRDARQNAIHNGIENAEFVCADAGDFMRACAADRLHVDVLLMDPPRTGASEEFLQAASTLAPERIVYISCNPETQARDARILRKLGYAAKSLQPVDMFPHTPHVETVCLFSKRPESKKRDFRTCSKTP